MIRLTEALAVVMVLLVIVAAMHPAPRPSPVPAFPEAAIPAASPLIWAASGTDARARTGASEALDHWPTAASPGPATDASTSTVPASSPRRLHGTQGSAGGESVTAALAGRSILTIDAGWPDQSGRSGRGGTSARPTEAVQLGTRVHSITGIATWYRFRAAQAAAGPTLRRAIGKGWRGRLVTVRSGSRAVVARLTDYMVANRLIDLDYRSFRRLAPLSRGIVSVKVTW